MDADKDDSCDSENLEVVNNNSVNTSNISTEDGGVCNEIFEALRKGDVRYLEAYLRENNGNTSIADEKGHNMLHHAVRYHQRACVLMLLQEVPDLLIKKNKKNETPLDLAVKHKCVIEIIEILVVNMCKYEIDLHILLLGNYM